ncbi:hypothetical protein CC80DRAFT_364123, partial [Byssothecium circinans]
DTMSPHTMKRKASQELVCAHAQKQKVNKDDPDTNNKSCRLIRVLAQYGLLVVIASNLYPQDLYALAATSKSTYKAIFSSKESRTNLLSKMQCAGLGVAIRNALHKKSVYFDQYNCTEFIQCGARDTTGSIESRPCSSCARMTCNECRIHCVYGSIEQQPDEPDDLSEFSGFALLSAPEMRVLTPAHMPTDKVDSVIGDPGSNAIMPTMPYHDQGFLDTPLESNRAAKIQSVDSILDFDLGLGQLSLSTTSAEPHPSPVTQAFWDVSEGRKRWTCLHCTVRSPPCHCTLRKQFLDRWLCLPCYQDEQ